MWFRIGIKANRMPNRIPILMLGLLNYWKCSKGNKIGIGTWQLTVLYIIAHVCCLRTKTKNKQSGMFVVGVVGVAVAFRETNAFSVFLRNGKCLLQNFTLAPLAFLWSWLSCETAKRHIATVINIVVLACCLRWWRRLADGGWQRVLLLLLLREL